LSISSLTTNVCEETVDANVNVALVIVPVEATFVTLQVSMFVLVQKVESETYLVVVSHVVKMLALPAKFAVVVFT